MSNGNNQEITSVNLTLVELEQIFGSRERVLAVVVSDFVRVCLLDTVSDDILDKLNTPGDICSLWLSQRRAVHNVNTEQRAVAV